MATKRASTKKRFCKNGHPRDPNIKYIKQCPICIQANADKILSANRERAKQWGRDNKERARAKVKQWKKENAGRATDWYKEYYKKNREALLAYRAEWKRNNKVRVAKHKFDRESKMKEPFPAEKWEILLAAFDGYCPYCDSYNNKLTCDHIVPISQFGTNAIYNLVPCCKLCNSRKGKRTITAWKPFEAAIVMSRITSVLRTIQQDLV